MSAPELFFRYHREINTHLKETRCLTALALNLLQKSFIQVDQCDKLLSSGISHEEKVNLLLFFLLTRTPNSETASPVSVTPLQCLVDCLSQLDREAFPNAFQLIEILNGDPPSVTQHKIEVHTTFEDIESQMDFVYFHIDLHELLSHLNSFGVLTVDDYCSFMKKNMRTERVKILFKALQSHPSGVSVLVNALFASGTRSHRRLAYHLIGLASQSGKDGSTDLRPDSPRPMEPDSIKEMKYQDMLKEKPSLKLLQSLPNGVKIMSSITPHWRSLAIQMDFDNDLATVKTIEMDDRKGEDCCLEMFTRWLHGRAKVKPTWGSLVGMLVDIEQVTLADTIKEALQKLTEEMDYSDSLPMSQNPVKSFASILKQTYVQNPTPVSEVWHASTMHWVEPMLIETREGSANTKTILPGGKIHYAKILEGAEPDWHVMVSGNPGMGKTVLCFKVCEFWATTELDKFELVFFISLQNSEELSAKTIKELVLHNCPSEIRKDIVDFLQKNGGKGSLFIVDGWDRLNKRSIEKDLTELLYKKLYPLASVIVTCRTSVSSELLKIPTIGRSFTLTGFSNEDIKSYASSPSLADALEKNKLVEEICTNPFNCAIICQLWDPLNEMPCKSLTDLYMQLVLRTIYHEVKRSFPQYEKKFSGIESTESIPEEMQPLWKSLCTLAFISIRDNKNSFKEDELELEKFPEKAPLVCYGLGLLHSKVTFKGIGSPVTFEFVYFMYQQFLAAHHLQTLSHGTQKEVDKMCKLFKATCFQYAWRFYFGLSRKKEINEDILYYCFTPSEYYKNNYKLHLCHCAYEARSKRVDVLAVLNIGRKFGPFNGQLTHHDCTAIAHVLSKTLAYEFPNHSEVELSIKLNYNHIGEEGLINVLKNVEGALKNKLSILCLCDNGVTKKVIDCLYSAYTELQSLKRLELATNPLGNPGIVRLSELLQDLERLTVLNVRNTEFTEEAAPQLISVLSNLKNLKELNLSMNRLGSSAVKDLSKALQSLGNLEELRVKAVFGRDSSEEVDTALGSLLEAASLHCKALRKLDLSDNYLGEGSIRSLAMCLVALTDLDTLWLDQVHLSDESLSSLRNHLSTSRKGQSAATANPKKSVTLYLLNCSITATGLSHIADAVASGLLPVAGLNMSKNPFGPEGAHHICKILETGDCKIAELRCASCKLGTIPALRIFHSLTRNTSLAQLFLNDNGIGDDGASKEEISSALPEPEAVNHTLKTLGLSHNNLTGSNSDISIFLAVLKMFNSIESLSTNDCKLTTGDIINLQKEIAKPAFSEFVKKWELKKWNLKKNGLDSRGVNVLKDIVNKVPSLSEVFLDGNIGCHSRAHDGLQKLLEKRKHKPPKQRSIDSRGRDSSKRKQKQLENQCPSEEDSGLYSNGHLSDLKKSQESSVDPDPPVNSPPSPAVSSPHVNGSATGASVRSNGSSSSPSSPSPLKKISVGSAGSTPATPGSAGSFLSRVWGWFSSESMDSGVADSTTGSVESSTHARRQVERQEKVDHPPPPPRPLQRQLAVSMDNGNTKTT